MMRNYPVILSTLVVSLAFLFAPKIANAGDIEWSGVYRIEGNQINNSEMRGSQKRDLAYGLSHLVLRPKINAGDGFTIYGQFDLFNNASEPNSQIGQVFGSGVNTSGSQPATDPSQSNTLSNNQSAESILVSQLYVTYNHEFGQLIAGRVPLQFGLGMSYSAGRGLFDHWYDTRDLVGYKVVVGNMYFLPMIGKPSEGNIGKTDDIDDYMMQVQYENPETDLEMGVFYRLRKGSDQGSDAPFAAGEMGGAGGSNMTGINTRVVNIYALRDNERFRLGMEASFMSGENGLLTASGEKVTWSGFGIAGEFQYRPEGSAWKWGLKAGTASGDDPTSDTKFEGFTFNRNYDVAMLMFNHVLGQEDYFRTRSTVTGPVYGGAAIAANKNIERADVEAISNVVYLAPNIHYTFNDKWALDNTLVTGWLGTNPLGAGHAVSKDVGYEWDASLTFSPRKGVAWVNQLGLLLPGAMWKDSSTPGTVHDNKFVLGLATKAAISF